MRARLAAFAALAPLIGVVAACHQTGQDKVSAGVSATYNRQTGRLEQLALDRTGRGKIDTRAYMDGVHLRYIEIDRRGTGRPDRWEYYTPGPFRGESRGSLFDKHTQLVRAEEANGPDAKITRWEFYDHGVIARVEEDTDFNGRVDKWERYENGALVRLELDLTGRGSPDRRLMYRPDGQLDYVEVDQKGDGHFERLGEGAGKKGRGL